VDGINRPSRTSRHGTRQCSRSLFSAPAEKKAAHFKLTLYQAEFAPVETIEPGTWKRRWRRFGWTREQLGIARAFLGYPAGTQSIGTKFSIFGSARAQRTDLAQVERWEESARACGLLK
jgi:hypothetical protein